jgi:hypothetical protein
MINILYAIFISSLIVGVYFIYDSYLKLIVGKISDYSIAVTEYEKFRRGVEEINDQRLKLFEKGYGLLESHSISSAWVSFGCFALFALNEKFSNRFKNIYILITILILTISLNLTAIFAFIFTIIFIEYDFFKLFFNILSLKKIKYFLQIIILLLIFILFIFIMNFENINYLFSTNIEYLKLIINGNPEDSINNPSFFNKLFTELINFPERITNIFFLGILVGDGFTQSFGSKKGGDYGVIEDIYRIGLPFFIFTLYLFYKVLKKSFIYIIQKKRNYLFIKFYVSILIYVSISEIHYSIWNSKSILILLFSMLAIFNNSNNKLEKNNPIK